MNLKVNLYSASNYTNNAFRKFGHKTIRNTGYAILAATMLLTSSCTNKNKTDSDNNFITEQTDSFVRSADSIEVESSKIKNINHYFPKDNNEISNNPDWTEKIYPDGRVEKDSMGYKIIEMPNGERTVSTKQKNENGDNVITTLFSDGSKEIRIENGKNYKDTLYWTNGNIKQIKNKEVEFEYLDSLNEEKEIIKLQVFKEYDENGILMRWDVIDNNKTLNENNFKYDNKGRIIDDGYTKYEYEGEKETPCRTIEEYEGCKLVTEFDTDSIYETKKYFVASNGVITLYTEEDKINRQ